MYIIHKNTSDLDIIYMEYDNKKYPIKINAKDSIDVDCVYLYDEKYINKVNDDLLPFEYIFNDLANIIFNYIYSSEDPDDDGTINILLGEVEKQRSILESQYKEFMKRQEYYDYVDKLTFLRDELNNRKEIIKYKNSIINGKSR